VVIRENLFSRKIPEEVIRESSFQKSSGHEDVPGKSKSGSFLTWDFRNEVKVVA